MAGLNCSDAPAKTATDGGVAGAGVLLSFIITAGISLVLSLIIVLYEVRRSSESRVLRKLLLSLSDQQVITGIGIQSIALAKMKTMVPYHFFIVWMLSLLSTATHVGTLLALVNDFKRDWVLRWLREFFMFVNLVLSIVSGILILMSVMHHFEPTLPIACVWEVASTGVPSNAVWGVVGTVAVMAGQVVFFLLGVWYMHVKNRRLVRGVQLAGLVVLVAIGTGAAVRVILLSQAFGTPPVALEGTDEEEWSFGQLLPLLMLLLPLVSSVEILRGEMRIPGPVVDDQASLLYGGEKRQEARASFQPNPFWGGQSSLLSKR